MTFAKNYGDASDGTVALGTKHVQSGNVPNYNDASRAQLSKPALFQGELRDKMRAVLAMKEAATSNDKLEDAPSTPSKVPGEVVYTGVNVSPTEVHRLQSYLSSKGIGSNDLREAEIIMPGASNKILQMAAELALGKIVKQPRFGKLSSIVRKLGLFHDKHEDHQLHSYLASKGIGVKDLLQADTEVPGSSEVIKDMAAKLALGINVRRPRFGRLGSVVRKLGLFDDEKSPIPVKRRKIQHTYNAPVQVFNGPVFFGGSSQTFQQMMVKIRKTLTRIDIKLIDLIKVMISYLVLALKIMD